MTPAYPTNADIADALRRIAELLAAQGADVYRVGAYRRASRRIAGLTEAVAPRVQEDDHRRLEAECEAHYSAEEVQA